MQLTSLSDVVGPISGLSGPLLYPASHRWHVQTEAVGRRDSRSKVDRLGSQSKHNGGTGSTEPYSDQNRSTGATFWCPSQRWTDTKTGDPTKSHMECTSNTTSFFAAQTACLIPVRPVQSYVMHVIYTNTLQRAELQVRTISEQASRIHLTALHPAPPEAFWLHSRVQRPTVRSTRYVPTESVWSVIFIYHVYS